ncbi:energy-coupling factor transporter transmembrane component T family protein [Anaerococcus octavius]|uniref:Transporter n=1 Tax=Anaerococcus octavius TaxID=54007 RepID=A0A2I1MAM8_9FIRM|nr:energy-coupling factor transporter transmembrane component T [Anaerococcus octavius]PKZ17194.1 transporter [Anaerococcus octavius]SUU92863.1 Energy-coupling factor transporter transmembrane protein EcfT [Anaerococcus octavius]
MNKVTIGQYLPFDTFMHRLDPRVKLIGVFAYIITIFFVDDFITFIPFAILLFAMLYTAKIPVKSVFKSLRPLLFIIIVTAIINLFTAPGNTLLSFGHLTITDEGVYKTLFTVIRLILIILSTSILTYTTSPMELTYGLEKLFSPLKRFGFPAGELAMMISISLRFIPTLFDEANKIRMAQMARGADFESGNIINRAKAMIPLLVPLFINSFKRSDELATAMEARMYRIGEERTRLNEIFMDKTDYTTLYVFLGFCVLVILKHYI